MQTWGWTYAGDVTSGLGALPGAASTPIGYAFAAHGTEHVTYMALDFSLWELTRSAELWTATNLLAAVGQPSRLTNWSGFSTTNPSGTADGSTLLFIKGRAPTNIYVAQLSPEKQSLAKVDRLDTDTWATTIDDWAPDSHSVYLTSNRSGKSTIYRQRIDQQVSEAVVSGAEEYYDAHPIG